MTQEWKKYQEEAAAFFRSLGFDVEVGRIVKGVRSCHQIDVYVTFEKWGMRHLWIVECKMHARPITKADVETLKSIASEVGANLVFLLSESGFQAGAFHAARKTNVVLSSLEELRKKSRDDVMLETINTLEIQALELRERLLSLTIFIFTEEASGSLNFRVPEGVDRNNAMSMFGRLSILNSAFDSVRIGRFPVTLPGDFDKDPNSLVQCSDLEVFVRETLHFLNALESWAAQQKPR